LDHASLGEHPAAVDDEAKESGEDAGSEEKRDEEGHGSAVAHLRTMME
jgi:hypothetical protein